MTKVLMPDHKTLTGQGFTLRDVRTGDVHQVRERAGSAQVKLGETLGSARGSPRWLWRGSGCPCDQLPVGKC